MSKAGRIIVNVSHLDHTIYTGVLGTWIVPGRGEPHKEVREYGVFEVPEKLVESRDLGWGDPGPNVPEGRVLVPVDSVALAKEVLQNFHRSFGDSPLRRTTFGTFIAAGDEPTPEELAAARSQYETELNRLVNEGNSAYARTRNVRSVDDKAKLAANVLGIKTDWSSNNQLRTKVPCPNCGDVIPATLAVHRRSEDGNECGYVLDPEKAKRLIDFNPAPAAKPRRADKELAPAGV